MILATSAFVLALFALGIAVAVWITSALRTRALEQWKSLTQSDLQRLVENLHASRASVSDALRDLEAKTPTRLAAEVAALADAVDKLTSQHRKLHGFVHATKHQQRDPNDVDDDELQAVLALQRAAPPPGGH